MSQQTFLQRFQFQKTLKSRLTNSGVGDTEVSGSGPNCRKMISISPCEPHLSQSQPKTNVEKDKYVEDSGKDFEQTLIYTGAEGTVLRFTYREFANNTARPAFTIDATYDIENDKVIRFKGASLEVISVDNQSITYKLVSGFKS